MFDNYFMSDYFIVLLMDAVVSVSVSVSAETESFIQFRYQFWPKRKIAILACFGFGRNEKKPFSRTLSIPNHNNINELDQNQHQHSVCSPVYTDEFIAING